MPNFAINDTLQALASFAERQAEIKYAQIGEPKRPPVDGIACAVFMDGIRTPELVLDASVRVYDATMRLYLPFTESGTATEISMADAVSEVFEDIEEDTDVNTTVRHADIGGIYGRGLEAEWGYLEIDNYMFRTVDITIPMIVDQAAASLSA